MARVLIVDGDSEARSAVARCVREQGGDVEVAASGEDALLRLELADFALVLSDAELPDMTGFELLEEIKRTRRETPVVLLCRCGDLEGAVEAMRLGAQDYLRKPREESVLRELVQALLGRSGVVAEEAKLESPASDASESEVVGTSRTMRELMTLVRTVAETGSTVLVTGETGTGKELVGRAIHQGSRRRDRVFSAVNAAAIPETLLESELFGHRRGAFTGAVANKKGLFEYAHQGTVFLDEVAEMPLMMQAKLLRFLQTGEIQPVGADSTRRVDVRLVAATNKNLEREVESGRFREDLYYRLAVIPVHVPPLRERREDIDALTEHFVRKFSAAAGKRVEGVTPEARRLLMEHDWPGNVRELENAIERGVALCRDTRISATDLTLRAREPRVRSAPGPLASLEYVERSHILHTLEQVGWNRKRAAEILEISTTTLWRRLKEFGVDGPGASPRAL